MSAIWKQTMANIFRFKQKVSPIKKRLWYNIIVPLCFKPYYVYWVEVSWVIFRWVFVPICFFLNLGEKYFLVNHFSIIMECSYTFFVLYTLYLNPLRSCLTTAMEFKITLYDIALIFMYRWMAIIEMIWSTFYILTTIYLLNQNQSVL